MPVRFLAGRAGGLTRYRKLCRGTLLGVFLFPLVAAHADSLEVPVTVSTALIEDALRQQVFRGPDEAVSVWGDDIGCNDLTISRPSVRVRDSRLHVTSDFSLKTGVVAGDGCLPLVSRQGKLDTVQDPYLPGSSGRIGFRTVDSQLLNDDGEPWALSSRLWNLAKSHVHPRLDTVTVDLGPLLTDLREFLPLFLPPGASARDSITAGPSLEGIAVADDGLQATLGFSVNVDRIAARSEKADRLSDEEVAELITLWEQLDAYMTLVVMVGATGTFDRLQRFRLLEALIDLRYTFVDALVRQDAADPDELRLAFTRTWERIAPVFREANRTAHGAESVRLLGFIAASDALAALDALSPATGLTLSETGLRRLARLLVRDPAVDPLRRSFDVDPQWRETFDFTPVLSTPDDDETSDSTERFNIQFFSVAWAVDEWFERYRHLDREVPAREDLDVYLEDVSELLAAVSESALEAGDVDDSRHALFRDLVLATAWQETCWRQYRRRNGQIEPMKSSAGALGLMQIMPLVWRGFYDREQLASSIAYNAAAGAEILHHYLVRYALKRGEDAHPGGDINLARASYAAYNGGPRHLDRYRRPTTADSLRKIDAAFLEKYEAVAAGDTLAVKECYGP